MLEILNKFETVPELAKRWGVTRGRVHQLVVAGRFGDFAKRVGRDWLIFGHPKPFHFMREKKN